MGDRLPHLEVGELLAAVVDLDDELVGQRLIALRIDLDARRPWRCGRGRRAAPAEGGELDLVGLERAGRRGAVRQHAVDDLVELRLAFAPIGGVALQPVIFAGLVLGELERAGADQLRCWPGWRRCRCLRRRAWARRWSRAGSALRISWNGVGLENLNTAVCSSGVSTASRLAKTSAAEILQRLPDLQRREGDVGRGERLAVMPGDALAQLEGDGQAVGRAFPAGREPRRRARPCRRRRLRPAARPPCWR